MAKYSAGDVLEKPDRPPAWADQTSADIEIDVQVHNDGYQTDRKWTVSVRHEPDDEDLPDKIAVHAVEHQNKGNYWRDGELYDDAVDFEDLPLIVQQRVAAILSTDIESITPDYRVVEEIQGMESDNL
jgi:hypothetical protein